MKKHFLITGALFACLTLAARKAQAGIWLVEQEHKGVSSWEFTFPAPQSSQQYFWSWISPDLGIAIPGAINVDHAPPAPTLAIPGGAVSGVVDARGSHGATFVWHGDAGELPPRKLYILTYQHSLTYAHWPVADATSARPSIVNDPPEAGLNPKDTLFKQEYAEVDVYKQDAYQGTGRQSNVG